MLGLCIGQILFVNLKLKLLRTPTHCVLGSVACAFQCGGIISTYTPIHTHTQYTYSFLQHSLFQASPFLRMHFFLSLAMCAYSWLSLYILDIVSLMQ